MKDGDTFDKHFKVAALRCLYQTESHSFCDTLNPQPVARFFFYFFFFYLKTKVWAFVK